jgi:hypothetical protein
MVVCGVGIPETSVLAVPGSHTGNCPAGSLKKSAHYLIHTKREKVSLNRKIFFRTLSIPAAATASRAPTTI